MKTEFDFIEQIRARASKHRNADLVLGIGDDAAILGECEGRETLVTTDLLVEDVDFKLDYSVPRWLGHKVLAVSLSDIAAMGGTPRHSLLTLGIPPALIPDADAFWEAFFDGYFALAEKHGVALVGGDLSSTPDRLTIDSIVVGHCGAGSAVRRSGARAGDAIYVTGSLGASAAGLKLLLEGARVNVGEGGLSQSALQAHLRPRPRVEFGLRIGESGLATSMIDLSDGLAQDLGHICEESRVAAIVDFDAVPVAQEARLVTKTAEETFSLAAGGGEDFELLLTADERSESALFDLARGSDLPLTRIGEIIAQDAPTLTWLRRGDQIKPLAVHGHDHFAALTPARFTD